jgi:hypothetical protein
LTKTGDDGSFYFADRHVLTAYEDYVYQMVGMAGIDMEKMTLVFDFGGCAAGTEITISDIIIRESQSAPAPEPEPTPGEFTPGAQLDLLDAADVLPGTWTWEASTDGHFGCGDAITNPCGWWNGTANCKDGCSMYDDLMTFAADGTYTYDPVDGMTFMNNGVTKMNDKKVDNPTVPGAAAPEETSEYQSRSRLQHGNLMSSVTSLQSSFLQEQSSHTFLTMHSLRRQSFTSQVSGRISLRSLRTLRPVTAVALSLGDIVSRE